MALLQFVKTQITVLDILDTIISNWFRTIRFLFCWWEKWGFFLRKNLREEEEYVDILFNLRVVSSKMSFKIEFSAFKLLLIEFYLIFEWILSFESLSASPKVLTNVRNLTAVSKKLIDVTSLESLKVSFGATPVCQIKSLKLYKIFSLKFLQFHLQLISKTFLISFSNFPKPTFPNCFFLFYFFKDLLRLFSI